MDREKGGKRLTDLARLCSASVQLWSQFLSGSTFDCRCCLFSVYSARIHAPRHGPRPSFGLDWSTSAIHCSLHHLHLSARYAASYGSRIASLLPYYASSLSSVSRKPLHLRPWLAARLSTACRPTHDTRSFDFVFIRRTAFLSFCTALPANPLLSSSCTLSGLTSRHLHLWLISRTRPSTSRAAASATETNRSTALSLYHTRQHDRQA